MYIFKIKITSRASRQTSSHTSCFPWDCNHWRKITKKVGGGGWGVKVFSIREMFNTTMNPLPGTAEDLLQFCLKKQRGQKIDNWENGKLQRCLLFLCELIYDECLIGFAANKHRWHTWPTSAPQIRLLHWPLPHYHTKHTNYGHSLRTIQPVREIWFQASIFLLNSVFSISLYICLDYCSPYCLTLSLLGQPVPEVNENGNYVWSISCMQVPKKLHFWGVKAMWFLLRIC